MNWDPTRLLELVCVSAAGCNDFLFASRTELQGREISDTENKTWRHKDSFPFVNRLWKRQNVAAAFSHKGDLKQRLLNSSFTVLAGAAVSVLPMVLQGHHKDSPAQQPADRLPAFLSLPCPADDWVSSHWLSLSLTLTSLEPTRELLSTMLFSPLFFSVASS